VFTRHHKCTLLFVGEPDVRALRWYGMSSSLLV